MNLKKLLLTGALMLATVSARALGDYKTIETDWTWDTYFSSFSAVTSKTIDPAGLGSVGVSTMGANVVGFSYAIYPVGALADFTISQTTKTYASGAVSPWPFTNQAPGSLAGAAPAISTSTRIEVPAGLLYNGTFQARTNNPVFTFSNLSAAATYYIWVELGRQRKP
jgi:hypothetical protein